MKKICSKVIYLIEKYAMQNWELGILHISSGFIIMTHRMIWDAIITQQLTTSPNLSAIFKRLRQMKIFLVPDSALHNYLFKNH